MGNKQQSGNPPATWLQGPAGVRVLPKYEQQQDGSWKMLHPKSVQALLNMRNPST
jgi:hypothetical protein